MTAQQPWFNEGSRTTMGIMEHGMHDRDKTIVGEAGKIDPEGRVRESH